jgi:hypothetical protein
METRSQQQQQPVRVNATHSVMVSGATRPAATRQAPETRPAAPSRVGVGLPCAHCRVYYPADMDTCPICKSTERISPAAMAAAVPIAPAIPLNKQAEEDEREQYLKQLKSEAFASHTQINTAATFRCCLDQNHSGTVEPAAVCHSCYSEMRQLADRLEAALHIDLKEAAQIVYNAVWADASDPTKTYQNAAAALLMELRKRAGIGQLLGSMTPLMH